MMTEPVFASTTYRKKTLEIMFEKLNIKKICLANQAVVSLTNLGLSDGVCVDIGHSVTSIISVLDGKTINGTGIEFPIAGRDLTESIHIAIPSRNPDILERKSPVELWNIASQLKENHSYVPINYQNELASIKEKGSIAYILANGETINLAHEVIGCLEILFNPSLHGMSVLPPIQQAIHHSISQFPIHITNPFLKADTKTKVVLTGGSACFKGFAIRLQQELDFIRKGCMVVVPGDPMFCSWRGAIDYAKRPGNLIVTYLIFGFREKSLMKMVSNLYTKSVYRRFAVPFDANTTRKLLCLQ